MEPKSDADSKVRSKHYNMKIDVEKHHFLIQFWALSEYRPTEGCRRIFGPTFLWNQSSGVNFWGFKEVFD